LSVTVKVKDEEIVLPDKNEVPLRLFPITVPLLSFRYEDYFRPLPEEEFTPPWPVTEHFGLSLSRTAAREMLAHIEERRRSSLIWYRLACRALALSINKGGTDLLIIPNLADRWRRHGFIFYPHQLAVVRRVVHEMDGRAILADEVGLGKTIEAGMIIKEYMLRGLVRRVLILTPAGLCWQWYMELKEKFGIAAYLQRSEYDWERCDVLIAGLDTAKRRPHCDIICNLTYDLVVCDEAHKLKNSRTRNWQFVNKINKKRFLMLTATPVHNDLRELYNMITLLKPGWLGTYEQFVKRYVEDKRLPRETPELKKLLSQVMIRNRRGPHSVEFTRRHVHQVEVHLEQEESELYRSVSALWHLPAAPSAALFTLNPLTLVTLQRELCSSPMALTFTLKNILAQTRDPYLTSVLQKLLVQAESCPTCSKAERLVETLKKIGDQTLVFTEYRATQQYLCRRLEQEGFAVLAFDGSLSNSRKEWIKELFRTRGEVLVSTEAGGEGLNFQFACHIVNYDLPWNPMRIEQRIGRVHRLGQTRDVHIYNMKTLNTIEEYIIYLLHEKINMFNMVIGGLEGILPRLGGGAGFEKIVYDILSSSADQTEIRRRFEQLAEQFSALLSEERDKQQKMERWLTW